MIKQVFACCFWCLFLLNGLQAQDDLVLLKTIQGDIRPKSIVHNGQGLFFAQNMMYRHTITVYDREMRLVRTLSDQIRFADYNITGYTGQHQGSPVEATFSEKGKYAWVSNFKMYGKGFDNPGGDQCDPDDPYDQSFIYKINTDKLEIAHVVEVGAVPKFLMATPDGEKVLVSNWCSGDLSVVDTELGIEMGERVSLGKYPRGIAVDSKSRYAYITVMGDDKIGIVKLSNLSISWLEDVGKTPRH
ncbi:MAG: YncE family protein, partial [Bacteroidota bacterium]